MFAELKTGQISAICQSLTGTPTQGLFSTSIGNLALLAGTPLDHDHSRLNWCTQLRETSGGPTGPMGWISSNWIVCSVRGFHDVQLIRRV